MKLIDHQVLGLVFHWANPAYLNSLELSIYILFFVGTHASQIEFLTLVRFDLLTILFEQVFFQLWKQDQNAVFQKLL